MKTTDNGELLSQFSQQSYQNVLKINTRCLPLSKQWENWHRSDLNNK